MNSRIIGQYKGRESGPLVIVTAAMHGNEIAGVRAMDLLFKMLQMEHNTKPEFMVRGELLGLIGNMQAYQKGDRYIKRDINRMWEKENIDYILSRDNNELDDEEKEIREILSTIQTHIKNVNPTKIYLLDLHTTSSDGIFCIAGSTEESKEIALKIHAPLVTGLLDGLKGTTLHYFDVQHLGIPSVTLAFEGGHHQDSLSINRCMAAVFQFLRAVGIIGQQDLLGTYDYILNFYNKELPIIVKVDFRFHVEDATLWEMLPGFKNFDIIYQGQLLATYEGKEIYAPMSGYILMPLYQKQGHDGFFVCSDLS